MCQAPKSPQTGPSSLVFANFSLFWLLISRSTWKGQAAGNAKKYWPTCHSMQYVMQPWCNSEATYQTFPWRNRHYHVSSWYTKAKTSTPLLWCAWSKPPWTLAPARIGREITLLARDLKCRGCGPLAYSMCMVQLWCNRKETKLSSKD